MAPPSCYRPRSGPCFPRVRGDGPGAISNLIDTVQFPPRTRGWPRRSARRPGGASVSPAYAGMAPSALKVTRLLTSFPRVRGDGPFAQVGLQRVTSFPPRTRGWPVKCHGPISNPAVSPAYAGMAPRTAARTRRAFGFPRVRGDGPAARQRSRAPWWFPPRTRGWPRPSSFMYKVGYVSPAYAGMAPSGSSAGQ